MPKGFLHGIGFLVSFFFFGVLRVFLVFFSAVLGEMLCPRVSSTGLVFWFLCFFVVSLFFDFLRVVFCF